MATWPWGSDNVRKIVEGSVAMVRCTSMRSAMSASSHLAGSDVAATRPGGRHGRADDSRAVPDTRGDFTRRARDVTPEGWEQPAPCEGWVARDVVDHMVEWFPGFLLLPAGLPAPVVPAVDDDPVGAWLAVSDAIQVAVDDPVARDREFDSPAGRHTLDRAVAMFVLSDVLVHTWDLARATGQEETLDPDEVRRFTADMRNIPESVDRAMRDSGHYGPRVAVADDADDQTWLLAFMGRHP